MERYSQHEITNTKIDETKPPMVDIKPVQNQSNETIISHKYKIPILSEIGYAINSMTTFTTATLVLSWLGIFIISITNPTLCRRREYFSGTYENKSVFCQTSKNINRLFQDLQDSMLEETINYIEIKIPAWLRSIKEVVNNWGL